MRERGLLEIVMICRYGLSSKGVVILVMFHGEGNGFMCHVV